MALSLNETRVDNSPVFSEMLDDLQANILKHHGRTNVNHIFLTIKNGHQLEARNWISDFAKRKVTNAAKQIADIKFKKVFNQDGGTVFTISLAASAYQKMDVEENTVPSDLSFRNGLKAQNELLADNLEDWEEEFRTSIDLVIIIADSDLTTLDFETKNCVDSAIDIFRVIKIQKGEKLVNSNDIPIEHFGYADGVSQPLFFKNEVELQATNSVWHDEAKLNLALVKDNGGKFTDSFGSYLVFRKLEQNVKAFKAEEKKLPSVNDISGNPNDELAGAMIVGRFEDGTEVTNSSNEKGITNNDQLNNDFDYSQDSTGSKCPFHAHIRITNPRADVSQDFAKSVRLVRRGITYDEVNRNNNLDIQPEKGVGLLFMCYQSDIGQQFEFIQSAWANHGEIGPGNFVGQDGIIGQGPNSFQKQLPTQWGNNAQKNNCDFSNPKSKFVTMKGGEYFFTPSISFLKSL